MDKLLLGASGLGVGVLAINWVRHRNDPKLRDYECPFCRQVHEGITENQWVMHVVEMRKFK